MFMHIHTLSYDLHLCTCCTMVFRRFKKRRYIMGTKEPCHSGESSRNHWDVLRIGMALAPLDQT